MLNDITHHHRVSDEEMIKYDDMFEEILKEFPMLPNESRNSAIARILGECIEKKIQNDFESMIRRHEEKYSAK